MQRILVVEDHEPEMRLMVWHLTDDGAHVNVTTSIGEVIADIEKYSPETVVFNSRKLGPAKDACIALIRALAEDIRIIDISDPASGGQQFIDVTERDEGDATRATSDDTSITGPNLVYMVNHRRQAG